MYPITENIFKLFTDSGSQKAKITVFQKDGSTFELTEADICTGGLSVDRYSAKGQEIEIGSAVSAELSLTLRNDGKFNGNRFQGAELFVQVGVYDTITPRLITTENHFEMQTELGTTLEVESFNRMPEDISYTTVYIPLGWFKVDNTPRALSTISISALDRMMCFDKYVRKTDLRFPCAVSELLLEICRICDVPLADNAVSALTNADYVISVYPEQENLTYRTLLIWIAQITGTCAYIDWNGQLRLEWYGEQSNAIELDESMRYSSDLQEQFITITGMEVQSNETVFKSKAYEDAYIVSIEGNLLVQENVQNVVDALGEKIVGFSYIPFEATTIPLPFLFPMDGIDFVKQGVHHATILTNVNYTLNGSTVLSAKGETEDLNNISDPPPFAPSQSVVIGQIKQSIVATESQLTTHEKATDYLNQTAASALGLYHTEITDENGATTYYWHDGSTLKDSMYICMRNAGGSFSTNTGWKDGNPVWDEGTDKYGNAVCSLLNAIGIQAEWIRAESISTDKLSIGQSERGTNLIQDSSFESNSLYVDAKFDFEIEEYTDFSHNDYWNYVQFSDGDTYDPSATDGDLILYAYAPEEGSGFDGNKAMIDIAVPPVWDGYKQDVRDKHLFGVETRNSIPINMVTHTLSFYYRFHYDPIGDFSSEPMDETLIDSTGNGRFVIKIQWQDVNGNQIGFSKCSFSVVTNSSAKWERHHEQVTPPNNAVSAKLLIGAECTDEAILSDDGSPINYLYYDLDGILFEEGTALQSWTCSQEEVKSTGVIIDSKGLNIADGKIYVSDALGRKVMYTDAYQILNLIGGVTAQKYNPISGDVSARVQLLPLQYNEKAFLGNSFLGLRYEVMASNGQKHDLGGVGVRFEQQYDVNYNLIPHPESDQRRLLSFESENGFEFNGARAVLISEPVSIQSGTDLNSITSPGWYYCSPNTVAATVSNTPTSLAFYLRVEQAGAMRMQTLTAHDISAEYKRFYQTWEPIGWKGWKKCF